MKSITAVKPRLGFAGVGWIGKNRLMVINKQLPAEIKAVFDPSVSAVEALKKEVPGLRQYDSFEALLDEDLEGVVIATPSALHAKQALMALDRDNAVFCQKPLGRTMRETAEVVRKAREKDLLLGVDFSYRHTQAAKALREVIRSGELGTIYGAKLTFHNAYGPDKDWYYDASLAGGGCLMDLGIHMIDLLFWLLNETDITRPAGRMFQNGYIISKDDPAAVEDYTAVQFSAGSDAIVQLACSWNLSAGRDAVIEACFYGERGGAAFRNVGGSFYHFTAEKYDGTATRVLAEPPDNWSGRCAVEWGDKLTENNAFDPDAERYVDVARALDLIYQHCLL